MNQRWRPEAHQKKPQTPAIDKEFVECALGTYTPSPLSLGAACRPNPSPFRPSHRWAKSQNLQKNIPSPTVRGPLVSVNSLEFSVHGRCTQAAKQLDDTSLLNTDYISPDLCTGRRTQAAQQLDDPSLLNTDYLSSDLCTGRRTQAAKQLDDPSLQCFTRAPTTTRTPNRLTQAAKQLDDPSLQCFTLSVDHLIRPHSRVLCARADALRPPSSLTTQAINVSAQCHQPSWRHQPDCTSIECNTSYGHRPVVLTRQIATRPHVTTKCQTLEFPHNTSAPMQQRAWTTSRRTAPGNCGNTSLKYRTLSPYLGNGSPLRGTPSTTKVLLFINTARSHTNQLDNTIPHAPQPPSSLTTEFDFLEQCHQPMWRHQHECTRPPSSLTTEFEFLEQCHQPMWRHQSECTSAAKQLDDRVGFPWRVPPSNVTAPTRIYPSRQAAWRPSLISLNSVGQFTQSPTLHHIFVKRGWNKTSPNRIPWTHRPRHLRPCTYLRRSRQ